MDAIDLYQIHWPEPDEDIEEGWSALAELQKAGQSTVDRRFQFQRAATGARAGHRAHHLAAAALLDIQPEIEAEILPFCGAA